MTIVQVKDLDRNDLNVLGDNVQRAIKIDHDRAVERSLARLEDADKPHTRNRNMQPSILAKEA